MEYALSLRLPAALKLSAGLLSDFGRVYLGDEFCEALLPAFRDLEAFRKKSGRQLTLCTPTLTAAALPKALRLVRACVGAGQVSEVVVNDLGLLYELTRHWSGRGSPAISVGRVLGGTLGCSVFSSGVEKLFGGRLAAFEVDSRDALEQVSDGHDRRAHFHAPYWHVCSGRFCRSSRGLGAPCGRTCGGALTPLTCLERSPGLIAPLYVRGNAYFSDNSQLFAEHGGAPGLAARYPVIKRIVVQAEALIRPGGLAFLKGRAAGTGTSMPRSPKVRAPAPRRKHP